MKKYLFSIFCAFFLSACGENYDFSLNSSDGEISLSHFADKNLVLYFGYTYCPDVCPATLSLLSTQLKRLNNKAFLAFISLDPLRDSDLNATNDWLHYFYANSTALIAKSEDDLAKIAKKFGVIYEKISMPNSAMTYSIAHSNEIFLFKKGKFWGKINDLSEKNLHENLFKFLSD